MRLCAVTIIFAVVVASNPAPAWAQAGWYAIPTVQITEEFDDNVFAGTSARTSDFITRFSPGLQAGYRSEPLTFLLRGAFDAEFFARNSEQSDPMRGKHADLTFHYLPIRALTLGLDVAFAETRNRSTLTPLLTPDVPANALESGNRRTTFLSASASLAHEITLGTSWTSAYTYTNAAVEGGITNTAHQWRLGLSHQFTLRDTGTLDYGVSLFEDSASPTTTSHALTLGWSRQLTKQTSFTFKAGPRYSDGALQPEISALLAHEFRMFEQRAKATLGYIYSEGFVIGQSGTVRTESVTVSMGVEPARAVQINLGGSVTRLSGGSGSDTTAFGLAAEASYQILRWLTVGASYRFGLQDQTSGDIRHNVLSLSLTAKYPVRVP